MELNQLFEGANNYKTLQADAARLSGKWAKSGLLEGISSETDKTNMAIILENQAKQLVVEANQTGGTATFQPGTGEQYAAVALPLVRKVFGQIAAKEFVSVQPMSLPAGLVFFLDFQYGDTKRPFTDGDSFYGNASANFGNEAAGGLYGAGRFGYSINQFSASSGNIASGSGFAKTFTFSDVNYTAELSASMVAGQIIKVAVPTSSIADFDVNGIRAFVAASGSLWTAANLLPAFTKLNGNNIEFFFTGSAAGIESGNSVFVTYYNKLTKDNARGDFEDGNAYAVPNAASSTSISIPEVDVKMRSEAIVAKTRKLKAQWTPEFSQDLNAFHSLDAEAELTSILSEYISLEVDLEILDMLIQNVPTNQVEVWSAKVGDSFVNGARQSNTSGVYYTQMSWFQTLGIKLQKISNLIHQRTLRGGANFMVVSPTVATILESIPGFVVNADKDALQFAAGVSQVGSMANRYTVYKNPYMTSNEILLGFKGSNFLETGAVYAPYVPLIMTPLVYDPTNFTPRRGVMTRYAKKLVRPEFYGKVIVDGLETL